MATTTYKGAYLPTVSGNFGVWGTLLNTDTFPVFDKNLGGIHTETLSSSNVLLSASESQNAIIRLDGTITTAIQVTTSCQGFHFVENLTSGSYAVTIANGVGTPVELTQGKRHLVVFDSTNGPRLVASSITSADYAAPTVTQGVHTIVVPAAAMTPSVTSGANQEQIETTSNKINISVLDFDASADEYACFCIPMPKSWDRGTVTYQAYWTTEATDTDGVAWGLQGMSVSDGDTIDASWGTGVVVTDVAQGAAGKILVTAESAAVTIGGSPLDEDLCVFRVYRDVSDGADNMAEDARLVAIKLFYTTDAATDD